MSLLIVGSVAFDSIKTPFGKADKVMGGSATYSSVSASYFTKPSLVAVVGEDFKEKHITTLKKYSIDLKGLEKKKGKTFFWRGEYSYDLNTAHTLETQLNVFADFKPIIPENYRDHEYVFLANIDPELQLEVLKQIKNPKLVIGDTMNFWIEKKLTALKKMITKLDYLIINESEARELGKEANIIKAAKKILSFGPKNLIIKRGEYGSLLFSNSTIFSAPAYPLEFIYDPTGAGDSFAGGFIGYIAKKKKLDTQTIRQAIVMGSVMASYNVEDFSLNRIGNLSPKDINTRYNEFKKLVKF